VHQDLRVKTINAARIDKKGFEVQLNTNIINTKTWNYEVSLNYANLLYNKVVTIAPGISRISLGGSAFGTRGATAFAALNETWGQLIGSKTVYDKGQTCYFTKWLLQSSCRSKFWFCIT